jgi:hypothetical protein
VVQAMSMKAFKDNDIINYFQTLFLWIRAITDLTLGGMTNGPVPVLQNFCLSSRTSSLLKG